MSMRMEGGCVVVDHGWDKHWIHNQSNEKRPAREIRLVERRFRPACHLYALHHHSEYYNNTRMRLAERLLVNCRLRPPNAIDFDRLEPQTDQVLSVLWDAKEALIGGCRDDVAASATTFRALDQNWSFIWPWMVAITKGILENPAPSAPSGLKNARKFVDMSAILLVYPIYIPTRRHDAFEVADALVRLNQSHPNILILMTNIWLRASELELGDDVVGSLMHGIGLSLEALTESGGEGARLLEGSSRDELEAFLTTTSFDLMGTLLKGFMLEASRRSPDINILSMSLTLDILRHVDLTRRDVTPVISLAFKTLTRRHFQPFDPQKQSSYAKYLCLVESLQLLTYTHDRHKHVPGDPAA
ncbi:hypothetical protein AAF712_004600 [Marasmius tenuissimus]|uniref:Uncharacterized protein n=1 Tax=Marasmius tenuissimus TaxID=585030 RepID=A0ABR3A3T0_9AGAR